MSLNWTMHCVNCRFGTGLELVWNCFLFILSTIRGAHGAVQEVREGRLGGGVATRGEEFGYILNGTGR